MRYLYDYEGNIILDTKKLISSRFVDKKMVVFGDSRTYADGHVYDQTAKAEWQGKTIRGFQQEIAERLGVTITSEGQSGNTSAQICARIRAYDFTNFDLALFEGGVNDYTATPGQIAPIGSTFDTSTVYGAWQSAIEYVMTNFPHVRIYMDVSAIAWKGSGDVVFDYNIGKIKKEVAELYNLPCKDLYKETGITILNRDYFYCDDPANSNNWHLHYNDIGHAIIGAELAYFINAN